MKLTRMSQDIAGLLRCGAFAATFTVAALIVVPASAQDVAVDSTVRTRDARSFEDGFIFHLSGSFDFTTTDTVDSGVLDADGNDVPRFLSEQAVGDLELQTGVVLGNLQTGTRGVGYRPLNTYLNASLGLYAAGAPDLDEEQINGRGVYVPVEAEPVDGSEHPFGFTAQGDVGIFLHSAYAELDGLTPTGAGRNFSLRAGRQSHWGIRSTTFDGATIGYETDEDAEVKFNFAARFGQRSGVYERTQNDPGLYGGATAILDAGKLTIKAEYAFFQREVQLAERDLERYADQLELDLGEEEFTDTFILNTAELSAYVDVTDDMLLSVSARLTDTEFTEARAGLTWAFSREAGLQVDFTQRIGGGLLYDFTTGRGINVTDQRTGFERRSSYEVYRLNFPERQPYSDVQLQVPLRIAGYIDIVPRGGAHIVLGDDEELSPYDATNFNFGLASAVHYQTDAKGKLEIQFDYEGIVYDRSNVVGGEGAGLMSDVRAAPENASHRLYLGFRYDRGSRYGRRIAQVYDRNLSLGLGAFATIYQMELRPYINNVLEEALEEGDIADLDNDDLDNLQFTDLVIGAELYGKYWFSDYTGLRLSYEFAQDSADFNPHLAAFNSVRATVEGRF